MATSKNGAWNLAAAGIVVGLFWLERRYPLRRRKPEPDLPRVFRNLAVAGITGLAITLTEKPVATLLTKRVQERRIGLLPALRLGPWTERLVGLMLLDYTLYWWHVLLHRVPLLWRIHKVHHTDPVLDTTTASRFHFAEFLASVPWRAAQILLLGVRPPVLALWQRLAMVEIVFHHSNTRLPAPLDRLVRLIVVTPRLHGIHHSIAPEETDSNFSSGLTVWDRLHGTLRTGIPQDEIQIGAPGRPAHQSLPLGRLLVLPFVSQR